MFLGDVYLIFIPKCTPKENRSLPSRINHPTIAPNICRRACVTNNFVSLGVAGSRKYVIRLVMFGGLVSFSYCSRFVLITVARIGLRLRAGRPSPSTFPRFIKMTARSASGRGESEDFFFCGVFKIPLPPLSHGGRRSEYSGTRLCLLCKLESRVGGVGGGGYAGLDEG